MFYIMIASKIRLVNFVVTFSTVGKIMYSLKQYNLSRSNQRIYDEQL